MRQATRRTLLLTAAGLAAPALAQAQAAPLRVLVGSGLAPAMRRIAAAQERQSGQRLDLFFAPTPQLIAEATSGRPFDLGVVPAELFRDAAARASFEAAAPTAIARVGYGVAVRAGAPKPDISTPDRLRQALLAAPAISTLPGSAAGAHVMAVLERLGIAEQLRPRLVIATSPPGIPAAVAEGRATLALFLTNVLAAPGVELAGPFPPEFQQDLVYLAARAAAAPQPEAAAALLRSLSGAEAAAALRAEGLTPG